MIVHSFSAKKIPESLGLRYLYIVTPELDLGSQVSEGYFFLTGRCQSVMRRSLARVITN